MMWRQRAMALLKESGLSKERAEKVCEALYEDTRQYLMDNPDEAVEAFLDGNAGSDWLETTLHNLFPDEIKNSKEV